MLAAEISPLAMWHTLWKAHSQPIIAAGFSWCLWVNSMLTYLWLKYFKNIVEHTIWVMLNSLQKVFMHLSSFNGQKLLTCKNLVWDNVLQQGWRVEAKRFNPFRPIWRGLWVCDWNWRQRKWLECPLWWRRRRSRGTCGPPPWLRTASPLSAVDRDGFRKDRDKKQDGNQRTLGLVWWRMARYKEVTEKLTAS